MFCNSIFNGDIGNWNVSNVIDMRSMFMDSKFNGDISSWNVSNVADYADIFFGCNIKDEFKPKFRIRESFDFGSANKKKVINARNILDTILKRIDNREDIMPEQYELLINFTSLYRAKAGKLRNLVKYCIE
jgi:surface protein